MSRTLGKSFQVSLGFGAERASSVLSSSKETSRTDNRRIPLGIIDDIIDTIALSRCGSHSVREMVLQVP